MTTMQAQESQVLLENGYFFPSAESFEQNELFGLALKAAESGQFNAINIKDQSRNSYLIDETRSIDLLLEHATRSKDPDTKAAAYFAIGNKYFERKDYDKARKYYDATDLLSLPFSDRSTLQFRLGYCYLLKRDFESALSYFENVSSGNNALSNHARYYEGICAFYTGDRDKAIKRFTEIQDYSRYSGIVPFYLAQIYFKEEQYEKAIQYAKGKRQSSGVDAYLLDRILGLSYLALEDYNNAIKHLEAYAENSSSLSENDAFQIARLHYEMGNYEKAKDYFRELSYQDSEIGQMSNFLLASTSLASDDLKDAQSAFKQSSKLSYFEDIQEESEFLYYKTSADLGDERIAINGLSKITENNKYHSESQQLLSKLLYNSKDTENAVAVIEGISVKSAELKNTYKSLSYFSGVNAFNNGEYEDAAIWFEKADNIEGNKDLDPELHYMNAITQDKLKNYESSQSYVSKYKALSDGKHNFELDYMMAYQEMDKKNYDGAIAQLEESINSFNPDADEKDLFDDAIVRLADLELVKNNYETALEYYGLAISNNAKDSDYILYQKAMIYGVNNQQIEKLTSLEQLLKNYPDSEYRDDALFQLAETLVQLGKNNQAYQIFNTIIIEYGKKSEYTATAYMRQGLISFNQGDLYAALNAYKEGVSVSENNEEKRRALLAIEDIYLYHINDPDAYFKYKESLTGFKYDDISKDSIVYNIALKIYKDNNYPKAIERFEEYIEKYPSGFYLGASHYYLAESYLVENKFEKALYHYQEVLSTGNSNFTVSALDKAAVIAFNHSQDFKLSHELYKRLIDNSQGEPDIDKLESLVYASFKISQSNDVVKYGELLLAHSKINDKIKAPTHYYMAKSFMNMSNSEQALKQFELTSDISDNSQGAEANYMVSELLFKMAKVDEAEEQAFKTAEASGNYPYWVAKSVLLLGEIYTSKKDFINATAAYESLIENFQSEQDIVKQAEEKLASLEKLIKEESRIVPESNAQDSMEFINSETKKPEIDEK